MTDNSTPDNRQSLIPQAIEQYVEPAAIFTVFIGSLYLLGWVYMNAYFERLGIKHSSMDFSSSYYLTEALSPIAAGVMILAFSLWGYKESAKTRLNALRSNIVLLLIAGISLFKGLEEESTLDYYLELVGAASMLILYLSVSFTKRSLPLMFLNANPSTRLLGIVFIYSIIVLVASGQGRLYATKVINGSAQNSTTIELTWENTPPEEMTEKEFMLIMYQGGNYYLTERKAIAPDKPAIYIVSSDKIKYVTTTRLK